MPMIFVPHDPKRHGTLMIEKLRPNLVEVYFVPPENARLDPDETDEHRARLLRIDSKNRALTIYPINTLDTPTRYHRFLKPKYSQVERISLEFPGNSCRDFDPFVPETAQEVQEILEDLPPPLTKDYAYGLGLAKPYRFIVEAVEALSACIEIAISDKHETGITSRGTIFNISWEDIDELRLELDKIERHARNAERSVKEVTAYNVLARCLGLPNKTAKSGTHPYRKFLTAAAEGKEPLSENDQNAVLRVMSDHARDIAEKHPDKLAKLRSDIELVTLENLIRRYEEMLYQRLNEDQWQAFFSKNQFILNLAFGYPVIKVQDQASVGGRKLCGSGEKIADFLVKNSLTNNTALIEIKTPKAQILSKRPYRNGVYIPASELSGAINQTLDQKFQFEHEFAHLKVKSKLTDLESYAVDCCLIIGMTPADDDRKKSFELFRRNSKDVEIVTFDELLEKMRQLRDFLAADEQTEPGPAPVRQET